MMPSLDTFFRTQGLSFSIIRNSETISSIIGMFNIETSTKRRYIAFKPNADIRLHDIILSPTNEKFFVVDIFTQFIGGTPYQLKAYYKTEAEQNTTNSSNTVFNIGNVSNSVIGNNNIATFNYQQLLSDMKAKAETSTDKEELKQIISLLEMIVDDKIPAKKGLLSSFGNTLAKHSWLTGQIANVILSWLTSKIS